MVKKRRPARKASKAAKRTGGKAARKKPARRTKKQARPSKQKAARRPVRLAAKSAKPSGPAKPARDYQFHVLEHTADVGLEVSARTLPALFAGAAEGFFSLIVKADKIRDQHIVEMSIRASDMEGLMVRFLQELNYMVQTQSLFGARVEVREVTERTLAAVLYGERQDSQRHRVLREIKGVTYHRVSVRKTPSGNWKATVYFDL